MSLSLPNVETVRQRIAQARPAQAKYSLMSAYLFCARASEIIGRTAPSDRHKTTARGPTRNNLELDVFELGPIKEEVAVWTIKTAKRGGKPRKIGLPLNKKYEPFTKQLVDYFDKHQGVVFPITRHKLWEFAKEAFKGLKYPVESYNIYTNGEVTKSVKDHNRPFGAHALRHVRASELMTNYGFDGIELSIYGGWTLRSTIGIGSSMSRYVHLNWRQYFPKLLKPRRG